MRWIRYALFATLLTLTSCEKSPITAWTEGYQKTVYGHVLEPVTLCPCQAQQGGKR